MQLISCVYPMGNVLEDIREGREGRGPKGCHDWTIHPGKQAVNHTKLASRQDEFPYVNLERVLGHWCQMRSDAESAASQ